jgi:hypothetical protein
VREHQDPEFVVKGSAVLKRLYDDFAASEYDKVRDGARLTELALEICALRLEPLREVLRMLAQTQQAPGVE